MTERAQDVDADLRWLPPAGDWRARIEAIRGCADRRDAWQALVALAGTRLDFVQVNAVDAAAQALFAAQPPEELASRSIKLAMLGSATLGHLQGGIRVAGLRRGIWIRTYEHDYGQYLQEILDPASRLHRFRPDVVLLSLDAFHLARGIAGGDAEASSWLAELQARMRRCWTGARDAFSCQVIQQAVLPVLPRLLGSNEGRLARSPAALVDRLNDWLREAAAGGEVDLLALDAHAARTGTRSWHDPALWHRAKQEVSPRRTPLYGDLAVRLVAAHAGRSRKCLVLDLDDTLWGGAVGEVGPGGIEYGQGSALGEAYAAVQGHARALAERGVVLAVCSKNDEATALAAFERNPEMALRREHFASFVASWEDKPAGLRRIAAELGIGLDAMVLLDDSPFERDLVRRELPAVAVPEPGMDPSEYPATLADAGYFEALGVTREDERRNDLYRTRREREDLRAAATDLEAYLRDLAMVLAWRPFDPAGLPRIAQLVNKTNQFNLTARRYSERQLEALLQDRHGFGLQFRLRDRHGDEGMIAVVVGRQDGEAVCIDAWLMSCRVIGRGVEAATLEVLAGVAQERGARRLVGEFLPTGRNDLVRDLYTRLGFTSVAAGPDGSSRHELSLDAARDRARHIDIWRE